MTMLTTVTTGAGRVRFVLPRRVLRCRNCAAPRVLCPVRASDDEDMVPILSGRKKRGFTKKEYEQMKKPQLLGSNTSIGWY